MIRCSAIAHRASLCRAAVLNHNLQRATENISGSEFESMNVLICNYIFVCLYRMMRWSYSAQPQSIRSNRNSVWLLKALETDSASLNPSPTPRYWSKLYYTPLCHMTDRMPVMWQIKWKTLMSGDINTNYANASITGMRGPWIIVLNRTFLFFYVLSLKFP